MSVAAFLTELRRRDIQVWIDGNQLRCNARVGALTPELRDELRERKGDVLDFLRSAQAAASQQSAIVPLQQNGNRVPVYGVPGHNGDVFCYRALAQALGDEQPFFGLQPPGLDGGSEPLTRIDDLAEYFAAQIRAFQPQGPCIIAGFCAGGSVAFELAQRLTQRGPRVAFVALFGSPHPAFFRPAAQLRGWLARQPRRLAGAISGRRWREFLQKLLPKMRGEPHAIDPVLLLRGKVEQATLTAVRAYQPRAFAGPLCLILPCREWAKGAFQGLRWRSAAKHGDEYFGPEGATGDDMLLARNAPAFAAIFRRAYEKNLNS